MAFVGYDGTVGGRNPAPVDTVGSFSHYLQALYIPGDQVVQDFFYQQYVSQFLTYPKLEACTWALNEFQGRLQAYQSGVGAHVE